MTERVSEAYDVVPRASLTAAFQHMEACHQALHRAYGGFGDADKAEIINALEELAKAMEALA